MLWLGGGGGWVGNTVDTGVTYDPNALFTHKVYRKELPK